MSMDYEGLCDVRVVPSDSAPDDYEDLDADT